jgi:hypothetical protein
MALASLDATRALVGLGSCLTRLFCQDFYSFASLAFEFSAATESSGLYEAARILDGLTDDV